MYYKQCTFGGIRSSQLSLLFSCRCCTSVGFVFFNSLFFPPQVLTPHDYVLPDGWIVAHSRREKRDYFFNQKTNSTQWHPPDGSRPR